VQVYAVPVEVREVDAIPRAEAMKPARLEAAKVFAT